MNSIIVFVALILMTLCVSGSNLLCDGQNFLPFEKNGRWGYIDKEGKILIEPKFEYAGEFSSGRAPVVIGADDKPKFGYIDETGELAFPILFDRGLEFSEGFAVVSINDKYGYIDVHGKYLVEPKFSWAYSFSDGMGRFEESTRFSRTYGFIDTTGSVAIKADLIYAHDFHEGLAGFGTMKGRSVKMGFIDKRGKVVIKPKFASVGDFSENMAIVALKGKGHIVEREIWFDSDDVPSLAYINKKGVVVIKGPFGMASEFSNGFATVERQGLWSIIGIGGKVLKQTEFSDNAEIGNFSNGLAPVNNVGGAKFINTKGEIIINTDFDWADEFKCGVAKFKRLIKKDRRSTFTYGFIDLNGSIFGIN